MFFSFGSSSCSWLLFSCSFVFFFACFFFFPHPSVTVQCLPSVFIPITSIFSFWVLYGTITINFAVPLSSLPVLSGLPTIPSLHCEFPFLPPASPFSLSLALSGLPTSLYVFKFLLCFVYFCVSPLSVIFNFVLNPQLIQLLFVGCCEFAELVFWPADFNGLCCSLCTLSREVQSSRWGCWFWSLLRCWYHLSLGNSPGQK